MSPSQARIDELEERVRELEALRNQLIGMSTVAKYGYRALIVLAGYGGISFLHRIIGWLNAPIKVHP